MTANYAGWALSGFGSLVVPALVTALADKDPEVRMHAACTLYSMERGQADLARDALKAATKDSNEDVRERATWALKKMGDKSVPLLLS